MRTTPRRTLVLPFVLVASVAASSCSAGPQTMVLEPEFAAAPPAGAPMAPGDPALSVAPAPPAQEGEGGLPTALPPLAEGGDTTRKIIKNADMAIRVESIDRAISRITGEAAGMGGYVLETRTEHAGGGASSAVVSLAVPVARFEAMLERVRAAAVELLSEHASGQDATQEYVDLESQVANLEATRARVREFLDKAQNVEEALNVNARLTEIEGEIATRKGRLQYLAQRAAYSTITVELHQAATELTPTPTATPTALPPLPPWDAGRTVDQASRALAVLLRAVGTLAIWAAIIGVPLAIPFLLVALLLRRARRSRTPPAP